jgi:hypothetical protein
MKKAIALFLVLCFLAGCFIGCDISSKHLEMTYEENSNEGITNWEDVENNEITTWDDAQIVLWDDVDDYSDWVYSEILFSGITDEMPIIETRVLDYQSNGKYFDGEKIYEMVGDQFDLNSFISNYATGTGVILICVVMAVITKNGSKLVACFFAGARDASVSLAKTGLIFGGATEAVVAAIQSNGDIEDTFYGMLEGSSEGYKWGAIYGAVTGGFSSKYCFVENTLVKTRKGLVPICEIQVGDLVYSFDEMTDQCIYQPVTQVIKNSTDETYIVTTEHDAIECTGTHPFLTRTGWVPASELSNGDQLLAASGYSVAVQGVEKILYEKPVPTYNLCVAYSHSFAVGNGELIVHNRCKPNEKYANKTYYFKEGTPQAKKYPKGVPFDSEGYMVTDDYKIIRVTFDPPSIKARAEGRCLVGNCSTDFAMANKKAGLSSIPPGTTWHHEKDMVTMTLLNQDLHSVAFGGVAHAGGESLLREFWAALSSTAIP